MRAAMKASSWFYVAPEWFTCMAPLCCKSVEAAGFAFVLLSCCSAFATVLDPSVRRSPPVHLTPFLHPIFPRFAGRQALQVAKAQFLLVLQRDVRRPTGTRWSCPRQTFHTQT